MIEQTKRVHDRKRMIPDFRRRCFLAASFRGLLSGLAAFSVFAADPTGKERSTLGQPDSDESARFFEVPSLVQLQIEISVESARKLASSPREYVKAKIRESGSPAMEVGVHLKGGGISTYGSENASYSSLRI